jgi:hypothetical protein
MDINQVHKLLSKRENPKLEFKREWYTSANTLDDRGWGEFLKDIIALANGNVGYIGQTAYLIIGVDDKDPNINLGEVRQVYDVPPVGMLSQIQKLRETTLSKLRNTCSPSLSDLAFEFISLGSDISILIIEIPSPAGVMKLDRDLNTRGIRFGKGTVLTRVGQGVNVADPTEINALQQEFKRHFGEKNNDPKKILHNLPQPDYVRFIGRSDELEQLHKLLHPQERAWVIVIDGIGGIGKSALALEIAHRYLKNNSLMEDELFDAIIWVSAKPTTLTAEGIHPRQQITRTLEDIYKAIAVTLGKDEIAHLRLESQTMLVQREMTQYRTLLIIDNLETIDDERVNAFIRELPEPTKCIVTTRHRIDVAYPIRLTGLPQKDARELIEQECKKKKVTITDQQTDTLYKRTGGVPLAVVWSVAQMGYGHSPNLILRRLGQPNTDIIRYCFEGSLERIRNKPSHLLLVAISLSNKANRSLLRSVTNLPELDCDDGLVELEKLSLANKQKDVFEVLPLVSEFALSELISFADDIIENMVLEISKNKHSSEPFIRAESYIKLSDDAKEELGKFLDGQMWGYAQASDEQSVYYYLSELAKLGGTTAIDTMKWAANGGLVDVVYYTPEPDKNWTVEYGIVTLINLGEIHYLLDLLISKPDWPSKNFIIDALGKSAKPVAINEIEQFLVKAEIPDDLRLSLVDAKEKILQRVKL